MADISEYLNRESCFEYASWDGGKQAFDMVLCLDQFSSAEKFNELIAKISDWANASGYVFTVRPAFHPVFAQLDVSSLHIVDNSRGNKMHIIFIKKDKKVEVKCPIQFSK